MGLVDRLREVFTAKQSGSDTVGKITPTGYEISGTGFTDNTSKKKGEYWRGIVTGKQ